MANASRPNPPARPPAVQRLRVTFAIGWPLCYASVLDMGRLWERLLRRAGVPLAYTQGFSPHPRLVFGSALPVGYTSDCEIVDVLLREPADPLALQDALGAQCPTGLAVTEIVEVPLKASSPQATMREARYRAEVWGAFTCAELQAALERFMARDHVVRARQRKGGVREYDLRPLVHEAHAACDTPTPDRHTLALLMASGQEGSGRPEELVDALGLSVAGYTVHRVALYWDEAAQEDGPPPDEAPDEGEA